MVCYFFQFLFSYDRLAPFLTSIQYQSRDHYVANNYPVWIQFTNINPIHKWATPKKSLPIHLWMTSHISAKIPKSAIFLSLACVLYTHVPAAHQWLPLVSPPVQLSPRPRCLVCFPRGRLTVLVDLGRFQQHQSLGAFRTIWYPLARWQGTGDPEVVVVIGNRFGDRGRKFEDGKR